ncbi:MAG: CopD family protein [Pseudomonadota bacterium]
MLWIKALHIFFVASWFAALLYLPRIFVNLALEADKTATTRLLLMARKLYRFSIMLQVPAVLLGLGLWLLWRDIFTGGWLHAKLALVVLAIGYNHACGSLLKKFENGVNVRSHTWFRYFNEVPAVLLLAIVILVVVKPF